MESAAKCTRIKGELDNVCWSTLASSSEEVQYRVLEDINNAILRPGWRVDNFSAWTMAIIRRQSDSAKTDQNMPYCLLAPSVQVHLHILPAIAVATSLPHDGFLCFC